MTQLLSHLTFLYGNNTAPQVFGRAQKIIADHRSRLHAHRAGLSERDSILIAYGDQVRTAGEAPLKTLGAFCRQHLTGVVSGIHLLPFHPSTSDDGFSVTDYRRVDPALGAWEDVSAMREHFLLMFDAVINHISSQSEWFQGYLRDDPRYRDFFVAVDGEADLSQVVRPRALPLLTPFATPSGGKRVWTTFSADQVDLNYKNPDVLLEILDILLLYVERGASFIRLDAIAYLWKEVGTPCIHLPQTHRIVQFLRAALDEAAAPHVHLITETNVPHAENLSYFGDGENEAQLVYNFALPPLTLHAFHTGGARTLSAWAKTLSLPSGRTTFLNFLASHDGIGLNAARGILTDGEIDALVKRVIEHGGLVSYKNNPDGTQSPYELNIDYFDALSNPQADEPLDLQVERFMAAQSVMLSLAGIPGIYFHSLFGSRGWPEGAAQTGHRRAINRRKCEFDTLQRELADPGSRRARILSRWRTLLAARRGCPAFHPHGRQEVLDLHASVFALERFSPDGKSHALCLHNVSPGRIPVHTSFDSATDLTTDQPLRASELTLSPYQVLWMNL
jgi:sucrose phosphorylase